MDQLPEPTAAKTHTISESSSPWSVAIPVALILLALASIVVLGILGEGGRAAQAGSPTGAAQASDAHD